MKKGIDSGVICCILIIIACVFMLFTTGCGSIRDFKRTGNKEWCLVDYAEKTADCSYDDRNSCYSGHKDRRTGAYICWPRKALDK